jgi:hypothetical protein
MALRARISESVKVGPFRLRLSAGRSGLRAGIGTRAGKRGWLCFSEPVGRRRRRR